MLPYGYGAFAVSRNLAIAILITTHVAHAETIKIAALGDSLTAGFGLVPEHGFVPQLQTWLDGQGADVVVINAGVSGDTTAGGLSRVAWTLTPDVDAMIIALGGNDFLRGLDPAVSRANLDAILSAGRDADVEMLLVGMKVGTNYGLEYKEQFEAMYVDLAEEHGVLLYPDFWVGLRAVSGMRDGLGEFMQPDGLHPNKDGVAVVTQAIGPTVLDLIASVD